MCGTGGRLDRADARELLDQVPRQRAARCRDDEIKRPAVLEYDRAENVEQSDAIEIVEMYYRLVEKKGPAEAAGTREKQGERQILALPLAEILTGIELLASCIGEPVQKIAVLAQVDTIEHAVGVHPREQWIDHTAQILDLLATGRRIGLLEFGAGPVRRGDAVGHALLTR